MKLLTARGDWASMHLAESPTAFIDGTDASIGPIPLVPGPDGVARSIGYRTVYQTNPWLNAAVGLVAKGFKRSPSYLYRDDAGQRTKVAPDSRTVPGSLAAALAYPGNRRSWQSIQHATSIDRIVEGAGVWFIDRDAAGLYTGFTRIPFRYVGHETIAGVDRYWDTRRPQSKRVADDVIHFGAWAQDTLWSPSAIAAMPITLQLYDAIMRHLVGFFRNSARPSGHVEVDRQTSKAARDLIRDAIAAMYTGPDNAGKVLVTSGKWVPITQNNDHSKIIELLKLSREEIVAVIGAPPPLVGILDNAIMSNIRELRSHYAREVVGPPVAEWEGDIYAQVIAADDNLAGHIMVMDQSAVLKPDLEARAATYKDRRLIESMNEIRATEDLPRIDHPDADLPWMPLNESPLGQNDRTTKEQNPA